MSTGRLSRARLGCMPGTPDFSGSSRTALEPEACGRAPLSQTVEDAGAAFAQAVKAGATVVMPVTDMFWGDRHGQVTDPFGHRWSLATRTEDVSPRELEQRAQKFFAQSATAGVQRPQPASRK